MAHAAESKPLAAAAKPLAPPAGAIVTAERIGEHEEIAITGKQEPAGVAPERLIFEIGSISKVFTSLLLAQAVIDGKVKLDTPITSLLGKEVTFADPRVGAITLRQLATHSSGLPRLPADLFKGANAKDPYAHYDRAHLLAGLATTRLAGDGPYTLSYSNFGVGLLGDLLSRVYGQPWPELVAQKITGPLGMLDTVVELNDEQRARLAPPYHGADPDLPWHLSALVGAGGLHSTAHDLLLFGAALLDSEKSPLAKAFALIKEPQTKAGDIGLGIMLQKIDGHRVFNHDGGTGGYRSSLQVTPETRTIRVVLINNSVLETGSVLAAARQEKPRSTDSGRILSEEEMGAYDGVYRVDESARFTILHHDKALWARLTGQPFLQLFPHETADRFFLKVVAAELQFEREDGHVTKLTLFQNGREMPASKTATPVPALLFPSDKDLAAYAGTYELSIVFTLKVVAHTLFVQLTGQPFAPMFATKPDRFESDIVEAALEFDRDADGKVTALKLYQNGVVQPAPKKP